MPTEILPAASLRSTARLPVGGCRDRKSTRLNSSHGYIPYAVFCLKKKKNHASVHETQLPGEGRQRSGPYHPRGSSHRSDRTSRTRPLLHPEGHHVQEVESGLTRAP